MVGTPGVLFDALCVRPVLASLINLGPVDRTEAKGD
jgi:hypothetical protein